MTHWAGRAPSASFARAEADTGSRDDGGPGFTAVRDSAQFGELRSALRRFVFPVILLCFTWYLGYVLLAAYAAGFMAIRVTGAVTVGLLLGLSQFALTGLVTAWYLRYARTRLDPRAAAVRRLAAGMTAGDSGGEPGGPR